MKWFINLSIKKKIGYSFLLIFFLLIVGTAFSIINVNIVQADMDELENEDFVIVKEVLKVEELFEENYTHSLEALALKSADDIDSYKIYMETNLETIFGTIQNLDKHLVNDNEFHQMVSTLRTTVQNFRNSEEKFVDALNKKDFTLAEEIKRSERNLTERLRQDIDTLVERANSDFHASVVDANFSLLQIEIGLFILSLLIVFIFIMVYLSSKKYIVEPVMTLTDKAELISLGNLDIEYTDDLRKDEVGRLEDSFEKMTDSLKEITKTAAEVADGNLKVSLAPRSEKDKLVIAINVMVENLKEMITNIQSSIEFLHSNSAEISAAVTEMASGAAETATAISETTSTVEEVSRTSDQLKKKSREASEIAQSAFNSTNEGKHATEETIQGIHEIGHQMDVISESIVRLTEQSKSIGDIINTVADLSEQSNLLSVNAAIEAARAGEYGKGFNVVAQEIKSLAEQSKQSAMQIRTALNDIQNAVNSVVLATEQGEKIIQVGVTKSRKAQEAISQLNDSIEVAHNVSLQSAVASQQQQVGMDQIAVAMENIKVASSQNAATAKQLEISSRNLLEISSKLKDSIKVFKL